MRVHLILPALLEALDPDFRPIKYSLFPPLGLATLAAYLDPADDIVISDEHVEPVALLEPLPDLAVFEIYVTSAKRAYVLADAYRQHGVHVAMGGLHATALPDEASLHADTVFCGPGEDTWPQFLEDFRARHPGRRYQSTRRSLFGAPHPRRDLMALDRYLAPNSIVVSRGCPHACDFCYKPAFYQGGRSFYTQAVDTALEEIQGLPGRHLFFLDDHLFGKPEFARGLFSGLRGMNRVWQAAGTVKSILQPGLVEVAAASGLRSLFVGFETLNPMNLQSQHKNHNLSLDYHQAVEKLHSLGIMVNASFIFGLDGDDPSVFDRTVEWAIREGIETATFHILTPYPGTRLFERLHAAGRIHTFDWDFYDTRHPVFQPLGMTTDQLEAGYRRAYREFYRWRAICSSAWVHPGALAKIRRLAYTGAWKKAEPAWDIIIRSGWLPIVRPLLEAVLSAGSRQTLEDPSSQLADLPDLTQVES